MTGTTSIATLAAISLDRYWAVIRPLEPLRALTALRARILAIATWIYAASFAIVPALDIGYGRYVPEGYLTSCSFDYLTNELSPRYFIFIFFCAAWLAPFCTISFCYLNIIRVVVYTRNIAMKNQEQRLSTRHIKEKVKRKAEIKLAILVITVIALFFVSWTPYAIVSLLGIFGKKELITPTVSMIPALFCKTTACINPFIYVINHPIFRKEFKKIILRNRSLRRGDTTWKTTITAYNETTKYRPSKDLSATDVEVLEMKDLCIQEQINIPPDKVKTISHKVTERQDSQCSVTNISIKSLQDEIVPPPSWFVKPKFSKRSYIKK